FAVSSSVATHVAIRVGLVCALAENGVDRALVTGGDRTRGRASLGLQSEHQVVGLVGRVCRQKGTDTFVDAAIRMSGTLPQAQFVALGDFEDAELAARLTARIHDAGLAARIQLAGHREDMADMFAALDVLAAPSRWEGFGLMLVEAMAAGVPVVASRVGAIPEVLGDAGAYVSPEDPAALALVIQSVLHDPQHRASMIALGHARAARFDWARTAARITRSYEELRQTA
ncbi:MAG: glycosyltransferase, partial [Pseudorhodobacter sp.]